MNVKFSKRILQNYSHPNHGCFESCIVYAIYSNEEIIGTFLLGEKVGFIDFASSSLRIDIHHHVFKDDKYIIVDTSNGLAVGEYKMPLAIGGAMQLGTLLLREKEYKCKKLKPDIRYSPFKKSTWGHFKMRVSNEEEQIIYQLKMHVPVINVPNTSLRPFDGEIQTSTHNLRLLFCGLFLLEQLFEIKDSSMI